MSLSSAITVAMNNPDHKERILHEIFLILIHLGFFLLIVGSWGAKASQKTTLKVIPNSNFAEDTCRRCKQPESACQKLENPHKEQVKKWEIDINLSLKREILPLATLATVGGIVFLVSVMGFIGGLCKTPSILGLSTFGMFASVIGFLVAIVMSGLSRNKQTASVGLGEPIFTGVCVYCIVLCIVQIVLGIAVLRQRSTGHTQRLENEN